MLGSAVANILDVFNPALVVLGGGVTRAGDQLLLPVREAGLGQPWSQPGGPRTSSLPELGEIDVVSAAVVAFGLPMHPTSRRRGDPRGDRSQDAHAQLQDHRAVAAGMEALLPLVDGLTERMCQSFEAGGRVYVRNGGSAADAQHLAAELVGRYLRERRPLPAVALTVDPSVVTCIANDYDFEEVFARQLAALAGPTDVVIGFTTSGRSANVINGLAAAHQMERRRSYSVPAMAGRPGSTRTSRSSCPRT